MSDQNNYGQIPSSNQNNYGNVPGQSGSGQNQPPAYEGNYGNAGSNNAGQNGFSQSAQQGQYAQNQSLGNSAPAYSEQGNGYPATDQPPSYAGAMGYNNGSAPEKPATPKTLKIASWLIYFTILIGAIVTIYQVANPDLVAEQAGLTESELEGTGLSADDMNRFVGFGMWVGVAWAVIQYALTIMFTIFMLRGANWARIVLTVICGFGCFSLFAIPLAAVSGASMLTASLSTLSALACVGAIVFMFLRPSNRFFAKMRELKQWQAFNQYK